MEALGRHILVELYHCNAERLNDAEFIESSMLTAAEASQATIVSRHFHTFSPHGVSGVIIIAESHVSIHTWPEHDYAALDIFTCGDTIDASVIQKVMKEELQAGHTSGREIKRGLFEVGEGERLQFKPLVIPLFLPAKAGIHFPPSKGDILAICSLFPL
jgi:S-adenosylmethionine decarboxylase proenzyme